jgi:hypothetical protein
MFLALRIPQRNTARSWRRVRKTLESWLHAVSLRNPPHQRPNARVVEKRVIHSVGTGQFQDALLQKLMKKGMTER